MLLRFGEKAPENRGAAFIAESAQVIGDVTVGEDASVWYGAVVRGDEGRIIIGRGANVQDCAVLHCDAGDTVELGEGVTVGHSAVVHGCTVGAGSLIGMHATLLNGCVIGKGCIIGAGALVPEGMVIPDGMVAMGVPARVVKPVTPQQAEAARANAQEYIRLARLHAGLSC